MLHQIKISWVYADAVLCGDKNFEFRDNDRNYQRGDFVKFQVVDKNGKEMEHALNDQTFQITYVLPIIPNPEILDSCTKIPVIYCVFGMKPYTKRFQAVNDFGLPCEVKK